MKRDVILRASVAAGSVSEMTISMDAAFSTNLTGTTITYQDESASSAEEKTEYKMNFAAVGGGSIGAVTINFVGAPAPAAGTTIDKPRAAYTFDPSGTEGTVTLISSPDHSFERIWKQKVRDSSRNEVVDNIAKIDVRVKAESGYSVSQTLTSASDNTLVLSYSWTNVAGGVVSGTVTFDASATASAGYSLASIRVTDSSSDDPAARVPARRAERR